MTFAKNMIYVYFLLSFIHQSNSDFPIGDLIRFARALNVEIEDLFIEED